MNDLKEPVNFFFNPEYFNSSSARLILDICKVLSGLKCNEFNITMNWRYDPEDIDMHEVGKELSKIVKVPFEYVETGNLC